MFRTREEVIDFNTNQAAAPGSNEIAIFINEVEQSEHANLLIQLLKVEEEAKVQQELLEGQGVQRAKEDGREKREQDVREALEALVKAKLEQAKLKLEKGEISQKKFEAEQLSLTNLQKLIDMSVLAASLRIEGVDVKLLLSQLYDSPSSHLQEKILSYRVRLEILAGMYRYVLRGGDEAHVGLFVAKLRESGSAKDVSLLDLLGKELSFFRHGSKLVIRTVAPSSHAQQVKEAERERVEVLAKLQSFDRESVAEKQTLMNGIIKFVSLKEFELAMTKQLGIDKDILLSEYLPYLSELFDDTNFDDYRKISLNSNQSLIHIAIKLEHCAAKITEICSMLMEGNELFGHDKLILIRQLQVLNQRVAIAQQRLVNEMFQRMLYVDAKTFSMLSDLPSRPISCPYTYLNFLKYKNNDTDRIQPVTASRLRLLSQDPQAKKNQDKAVDSILPVEIAKYMLYIARNGSRQQKSYLESLRGVADPKLNAIVAEAKVKEIVYDENEIINFRAQSTYFGDWNLSTFQKIIKLCQNAKDYDNFIFVFSNIGSTELRNSLCRVINSDDICANINDATRLVELMKIIDKNDGLQAVFLDMLKKFKHISVDDLWQLMRAITEPEKYYGHRLRSMFFVNCLEEQMALDEQAVEKKPLLQNFMKVADELSSLLKKRPFLYILYNCIEQNRIAKIFENVFEIKKYHPDMEFIYDRSLAVAAGPLSKIIFKTQDKDACIEDLLNYIILVNKIVDAAASNVDQGLEQTIIDYVYFSHLASKLHSYGLKDGAINILMDKMNQNGIFTSENPVIKMRQILMQTLLFVAKADYLQSIDSSKLIEAAIRLYGALKSASQIGEKEKLSLFSAAAAIVGEAGKSPVDRQKVEKYMKLILTLKGAKLVAAELKSLNAVLLACLPSAEVRAANAPSVLHARNPALSPRGARRSPEAAPAAPNPRDNRKK